MKYISVISIIGAVLFLMVPSLQAQTIKQGSDQLQVADVKLCHAIKDRVVEDEDSTFVLNSKVFLWIRTTGGTHHKITVTWKTGSYTHSTTLMIGGSPWRTWASKIVRAKGDWIVTVIDEKQTTLQEKRFTVR